jgi:hypothetical protein
VRLSFDLVRGGQVAVVTLSRRNLLALLHKLELPGSARAMLCHDCPEGWMLELRVESDEDHYGGRPFPPGEMHPETEAFVADRAQVGEDLESDRP